MSTTDLILRSEAEGPLPATAYDSNMRRLAGALDLPDLLSDNIGYDFWREGEIIHTRAEGFRYQVLAENAEDECLETAGGLLLRVLPGSDGTHNFMAWNPDPTGASDNYAKLVRAVSVLPDGGTLFFPAGTYYSGQTVFFKKVVHLKGTRSGMAGGKSAILKFPADVTGLKFERANTFDGEVVSSSGASDGSIIEGLDIQGTMGSDPTKHGIHAVCRIFVYRCHISHFSGDGLHVYAASDQCDIGDNHEICGNANGLQIYQVRATNNGRNGIHVQGYDSQAGLLYGCDVVANGYWGIFDNSFLGNTHIGHHAAYNGNQGSGTNTAGGAVVWYDGKRWSAHGDASEAQLVANAPGTNPAVWVWIGGTEEKPHAPGHHQVADWEPDQPEGTYHIGGAYYLHHANGRNAALGLYSESSQGANYVRGPALVMGGALHAFSRGGSVRGTDGNTVTAASLRAIRGDTGGGGEEFEEEGIGVSGAIASPSATGSAFSWHHPDEGAHPWMIAYADGLWRIKSSNTNNRVAAYLTGTATTMQMGTGEAQPYLMGFPSLALGSGNNARRMTNDTAAPNEGGWARGDIVWNINPSAGGHAGWICVTAGTPGTWKTFGAISE